jgi:hypothetical protein
MVPNQPQEVLLFESIREASQYYYLVICLVEPINVVHIIDMTEMKVFSVFDYININQ